METKTKTPKELLEAEFLKAFKKVSIKEGILLVSDGENEQDFCADTIGLAPLLAKYDQVRAEELVATIELNFKHIFGDEN